MSKRDPIKMAAQIAGVRASESRFPEDERVCFDPYAQYFLSPEIRKGLEDLQNVKDAINQYEMIMPGVNGAVVSRVRYIDDYIKSCLKDGIRQMVIIGAGYDTRAYRIESLDEKVKVFEVDHPATQEVKKQIISEIFGELPKHVVYTSIVFGTDRLDQKLIDDGYDTQLKTLFILEGLIMYIPPAAVDGLFKFIVNSSGPGSSIIADYFNSSVVEGKSSLKEAQMLKQFVEKEGSPLLFGIPEGKENEFFEQRGFQNVVNVNATDCKKDYFTGASQTRTVSPIFNFVHAVTNPK